MTGNCLREWGWLIKKVGGGRGCLKGRKSLRKGNSKKKKSQGNHIEIPEEKRGSGLKEQLQQGALKKCPKKIYRIRKAERKKKKTEKKTNDVAQTDIAKREVVAVLKNGIHRR